MGPKKGKKAGGKGKKSEKKSDSSDDSSKKGKKGEKKDDKKDDKKDEKEKKINLEIHAEMALLQEAREGKTPEGFAGKKYQEEKSSFVRNIVDGSRPIRLLLHGTGRFPLTSKHNSDGTVIYEPKMKSPQGIYFIAFTVWTLYVLFMGTYNLTEMILNFKPRTLDAECHGYRLHELIIFDRNIVTFAILWQALCHVAVANINLYFKRDYFAKYLSFWTVAIHSMHVDVARGLKKPTWIATIAFCSCVFILSAMAICRISSIIVGAPALFSILELRWFYIHLGSWCLPHVESDGGSGASRSILDAFAWLFIVYIFTASKAVIFLFWFVCKMLTKAFVSWNGRFQSAILRTGGFVQSTQGRTTFQLLYKDHCILLDLLEGTDKFFGSTIEAYFSLQVVSVIFEIYFALRTMLLEFGVNFVFGNDFHLPRYRDSITGMIIVLVNCCILVFVLQAAADVGDEATAGLEVIRRRTMLGKRTDEELFFTVSMFSSYTCYRLVRLRGGGFFYFDKELIVTVFSLFLSYFIVTYQFQPQMDYDYYNGSYADDVFQGLVSNTMNQADRANHVNKYVKDFEKPPEYIQDAINKLNHLLSPPAPPPKG